MAHSVPRIGYLCPIPYPCRCAYSVPRIRVQNGVCSAIAVCPNASHIDLFQYRCAPMEYVISVRMYHYPHTPMHTNTAVPQCISVPTYQYPCSTVHYLYTGTPV